MTVKVVQGLIGQTRPPTQPSIVTPEQVSQQLGTAAASQAAQAVTSAARQVSNDAVLVSTRAVTKSSSPALRDPEKAQRVADEVSDELRRDPTTGSKAHDSLSSSRASQYL